MKKKHTLLECLFGHHDYDDKVTKDKTGYRVHRCKVCGRSAYYINRLGEKVHRKYNEKGACVHVKFSHGEENWFNEKGVCVRIKFNGGADWHFDGSKMGNGKM